MRPSWAVTNPPVIRNVAKATIQKMKTDGPANCTPAALLMNRTIATKITTRSNGPRVRATSTGAIFSEIITSLSPCMAIQHPLLYEDDAVRAQTSSRGYCRRDGGTQRFGCLAGANDIRE